MPIEPGNAGLHRSARNLLSEKITVVLMTRNEESRVDLAIKNYEGLFPIVASDNHSTDGTHAILEKHQIPVHLHAGQRQESRELVEHFYEITKTPYIIMGLVGEFMPLPLLRQFAAIAEADSYDLVLNTRHNVTQGVSLFGWWREVDVMLRFFKRGTLDLDKLRIHNLFQPLVSEERVLRMGTRPEYCIYQLRDYDTRRLMQVDLDYGIQEADQRFRDGETFSVWQTLKRIALHCLFFVTRGGWRMGRIGVRELWSAVVLTTIVYWRGSDLRYETTLDDCIKTNRKYRLELFKMFNGENGDDPSFGAIAKGHLLYDGGGAKQVQLLLTII